MSADNEHFVSRWSRLKQEQAKEQEKEQVASPAEREQEEPPQQQLPRVEDLKADSDFKPFMDPRVDLDTRRSALKKLFTDGHFKAHDAFEPYSIDLTGEDPIPAEMLKTLNHARRLLSDERKQVEELVEERAKEATEKPLGEAKDVAGKQDA